MRLLICSLICVAMMTVVGCRGNSGGGNTSSDKGNTQMMSQDACGHCEGVQTAKADGSCPKCGMKMNKSSGNTTGATGDACPQCPGTQMMSNDGKCPSCGMKM